MDGKTKTASQERGQRHHYVPEFYLRQWAGDDGCLCQIHRPADELISERVIPKRTGYERGLYAVAASAPDKVNEVEEVFLKKVDQEASDLLDIFLKKPNIEIPDRLRHSWARFLMTMMQRHPEKVRENSAKAKVTMEAELASLAADWENIRRPGDPEKYEDAVKSLEPDFLDKFGALALRKLGDLPNVGEAINRMVWHAVEIEGDRHSLLTSDRPVVMSNGLGKPDAHILMPLSPTVMFVATKREEERRRIHEMILDGVAVSELNDRVVRQAHRFVYGVDDRQMRFVENRVGAHFRSRPSRSQI